MIVGTCVVELHLASNTSLKGKRASLKPLIVRLHREFNVSAAEIDHHDSWQSAALGLACVANDPAQAEQILNNAVHWIEHHRPDLQVVDWQIEII